MDLHGVAKFPGITSFIACNYTCSHGITPSAINYIIPTTTDLTAIPEVGDMVITDGERTLTLKDCKPVAIERQRNGDGYAYVLSLLDHRWRWQFGDLVGVWNERDAHGEIIDGSQKTLNELAKLCLDAMGEVGADLALLPEPEDEGLPSVNWDHVNPAQALADLCEQVNCRVVWQPNRHRVLISPTGKGETMPKDGYTEFSPALNSPVRPSKIRLIGAPMVFTCAVVLDPVGEDLDGSIVPIDDLSYTPTRGWKTQSPNSNMVGNKQVILADKYKVKGMTDEDAQAACRKSVWRYYRVTVRPVVGDEFKIPGIEKLPEFTIDDYRQIVPLDKILGARRDENRVLYADPPRVYGSHCNGSYDGKNTTGSARVDFKFSIDSARGLVVFEAPVYRQNISNQNLPNLLPIPGFGVVPTLVPGDFGPAEIVLVTSIHVRDESRQLIHYTSDREIGGKGGVRTVKVDELQFVAHTDYLPAQKWITNNEEDNSKECAEFAKKRLKELDDYDNREAETKSFPRVMLVDPDGAIQQVSWDVRGSCSTQVSRNTEHAKWIQPYRVRRGQERVVYERAKAANMSIEIIKQLTGGVS